MVFLVTERAFRFLHVSDTHLGYKQYGYAERMNDFYRSFKHCLEDGVKQGVNAVLICGDFFDERNVPPEAFDHAVAALEIPKKAGIEVLLTLGNHDAPWRTDAYSWPQVLEGLGLCKILAPDYEADGSYRFNPYEDGKGGGYVDHAHVRIYGLPFQGQRLRNDFPLIVKALPPKAKPFNAFMAHFGVHGQISQATDGVPFEAFEDLHSKIDYLALGHYHKRYELPATKSWVFNPGGTENRDAKEVGVEKGYYIVTVQPDGSFQYQHHRAWERPYYRWEADLSGVRNAAEAEARIHSYIEAEAKKVKPDAIIELKLTGRTEGGDIQIDVRQLETDLRGLTTCVFARVLRQTTSAETDIHISAGERFDPKDVEHEVLTQALVGRFPGFKPAAATETARLVVDLKNDLLKDDQPEHVLAKIRRVVATLPKTEAKP